MIFYRIKSKVSKIIWWGTKGKKTEGGLSAVCELMEKYNQEAIQEHDYKAIAEMLRDNVSSEKICQYLHVTEEDIQVVKSSLFQLN